MRGLTLNRQTLSDVWIAMGVEGEIDLATVAALEEAIEEVFTDGASNLVVDLTTSSFMDSTGLRVLVMAHRRFEDAARQFALAVSGGPVSRLIDLSGVAGSMRVVDSPSQVLES